MYTQIHFYLSHLVRPESKKDVKGKNGTNDDVDADEEEVDLN